MNPDEKIQNTFEEGYLRIHDRLDIVQMVQNFEDLKIFMNHVMTEELSTAFQNNEENVIILDKDPKVEIDDSQSSMSVSEISENNKEFNVHIETPTN